MSRRPDPDAIRALRDQLARAFDLSPFMAGVELEAQRRYDIPDAGPLQDAFAAGAAWALRQPADEDEIDQAARILATDGNTHEPRYTASRILDRFLAGRRPRHDEQNT